MACLLMPARSATKFSRPVTENLVVGGPVRAMQKSGLPISERPNLLLKGSGRVNRILGPEEDLSDALTAGEKTEGAIMLETSAQPWAVSKNCGNEVVKGIEALAPSPCVQHFL